MMNKIIYIAAIILMSSCSGWFDSAPNGNSTSGDEAFKKEVSYRDYMNGIYSKLRSNELYGGNLTVLGLEFLSGDLYPIDILQDWAKYDFSDAQSQKISGEIYSNMYNVIYSCNDILRLFNENKDVVFIDGAKEMMVAEAKALRAFAHFELLRLYNPAYVVNKTAKNIHWVDNVKMEGKELSSEELIKVIISELDFASKELEKYDPIVTGIDYDTNAMGGTSPKNRRWKLNYYAVQAIYARALMYIEDYDGALKEIDKVLESGEYPYVRTIAKTDYSMSAEFIFSIPPTDNEGISINSETLLKDNSDLAFAADIDVNELGADDRRRNWIGDNVFLKKFSESSLIDDWNISPPTPIVKISELQLMAVESAYKSNMLPRAIELMNDFMTNRNSTELTLATTASEQDVKELLEKQYKYEFIAEGVSFHYYKRTNAVVEAADGSDLGSAGEVVLPIVK